MTRELAEQMGWKKVGVDHFTSGSYELRKLNTGNWVFRHEIKDYAYITIGKDLSPDILPVLHQLMISLNHCKK